tara:strand:+ start:65 stop:211 length:147 start_codon:yes stop_codon:yes gene_type:complete
MQEKKRRNQKARNQKNLNPKKRINLKLLLKKIIIPIPVTENDNMLELD